jgi:murein DD-endopeptidase MepM/ murein hydrolase activator NlpD
VTGRSWLLVITALLGFAGGAWGWMRFERGAPQIDAPPEPLVVGAGGRELELALRDAASGVRQVKAVLVHPRGEAALLEESYPGNLWSGGADRGERHVSLRIDPVSLDLPDGSAVLRISASDWSLRGNETTLELPVTVDRKPPRITVTSGLTYVNRGGSGVVVYRVSEKPARTGVQVGDAFFRGYPVEATGQWVSIFAIPPQDGPEPQVRVVAEDAAGNRSDAGWPTVIKDREFPHAEVSLPASFLDTVVKKLATSEGIATDDLEAAFREINTRVRAKDEARIRELVADSAPYALWQGPFEQLRNSKVTSRFAERRDYVVGGVKNSEATHYGYDLASTQAAPVTATAAGRVRYAGELGIYGNCVLIDHGLGVASLYGHLSRLDVAAGDNVTRGQTLGLSGSTGLAGGDHLHFAILVGDTYVDPLEWWDASWIETHVDSRVPPRLAHGPSGRDAPTRVEASNDAAPDPMPAGAEPSGVPAALAP